MTRFGEVWVEDKSPIGVAEVAIMMVLLFIELAFLHST